jgi:Glycosyl transferase family 2
MTLIDVITPVRDGLLHLPNCAASLLDQGLPRGAVRWVVIDDASHDGTARWLDAAAARSVLDIWWGRLEEPGGAGAARNVGLDHVRGQFVTFLDVDDTLDRGALAAWVAAIMWLSADLLLTPAPRGLSRRRQARWRHGPRLLTHHQRWSSDAMRTWLVGGKVYRTEMLRGIGFPESPEAEDLAFFSAALLRATAVGFSGPAPRYHYDRPSTSTSLRPMQRPVSVLDTYGETVLRLRDAAPDQRAFESVSSPVLAGQSAAYLRAVAHALPEDVSVLSARMRLWWDQLGLDLPRDLGRLDRRDMSQVALARLCLASPGVAKSVGSGWIHAAQLRASRRPSWPGRSARTEITPRT